MQECGVSTMVLRALSFVAGLLPWRAVQRIGAFLGLVWFYLVPIRRRTVLQNLELALPERSDDHWNIARGAYRGFGIGALELLRLGSMGADEIARLVETRGLEHYEAAAAGGRGVVVVTAHYGNFDLLACSQAASGVPLAIVSRQLHQGGVSRFWMETRKSSGLEIFVDEGSARPVMAWLRRGNVLGLTVDQRTSEERGGVLVDFLGVPAWTTTAPARIAMRRGAAVLPVHIERGTDGAHVVIVEPPLSTEGLTGEPGIEELTREINRSVGAWVRRRPEHFLWLHRRFSRQVKPSLESTKARS